MDRAATLELLDGLVERGGGVALFGESHPDVPANDWRPAFQAAIDRYSSDDPARPKIRAAASNESILLQSSFDPLERVNVLEPRRTPVERFVDRALSFASTWHVIEGHALIARRSRDLLGEALDAGQSSDGATVH